MILTRTLSSAHPLHQMLKYHCRDVTVPNTIGAPKLLDEGQIVDELFASGNKGATRLLTKAHPLTTWDVTDFKNEIRVCDVRVSLSIFDAKNNKTNKQTKTVQPFHLSWRLVESS